MISRARTRTNTHGTVADYSLITHFQALLDLTRAVGGLSHLCHNGRRPKQPASLTRKLQRLENAESDVRKLLATTVGSTLATFVQVILDVTISQHISNFSTCNIFQKASRCLMNSSSATCARHRKSDWRSAGQVVGSDRVKLNI